MKVSGAPGNIQGKLTTLMGVRVRELHCECYFPVRAPVTQNLHEIKVSIVFGIFHYVVRYLSVHQYIETNAGNMPDLAPYPHITARIQIWFHHFHNHSLLCIPACFVKVC